MKWYIFPAHTPYLHAYCTHSRVGGRVPWGGVCVVYSDKYTDRVNIVLTTRVTVNHICTRNAQSAYFLGTLDVSGTINLKNYGARQRKCLTALPHSGIIMYN